MDGSLYVYMDSLHIFFSDVATAQSNLALFNQPCLAEVFQKIINYAGMMIREI